MRKLSTVLITLLLTMASVSPAVAGLNQEQPTVLITGSNRGIGLGFVKHYAAEGWNVIATCRKPEQAEDLAALQREYPNIVIEQLDVTDHARIDALADAYRDQPIDLLVNNAAILGSLPEQKIGGLDYELF
jgi:NAD(P)-dependent dehydrogenase (short-subunit alcohol dehydrogenase family)